MFFQAKRARNLLARVITLLLLGLLSTTAIAHAQNAPTISIVQDSPTTDPVPFGSDVEYTITVAYNGQGTAENLMVDLIVTDIKGQVVQSAEDVAIGTLTAGDTYEINFTVFNVTEPLTLDTSVNGALILLDTGSGGGTTTLPLPEAVASVEISVEYPDLSEVGGVGTPGYWKNHHDVWEDLPVIIIGDYNMNWVCDADESCLTLSNEDALFMLSAQNYNEGKDKRYTLYRSLTAAWLNILAGNEDNCISDTIDAAITWLQDSGNPLIDGDGKPVKGKFWSGEGNELYKTLDIYNNLGSGCAADRDTGKIKAGSINANDPAYRYLKLGQLPIAYLPILVQ